MKDLKSFNFKIFEKKFVFTLLIITIFAIHQLIFQNLLIFENYLVAEDLYFYVPNLVFGKIWFMKNGIFIPPEFAAHQCGIIPFHADPNSMYYSLIQFLFFLFTPALSIKIFFFFLSFIALFGSLLLFYYCFNFSKINSLICSTLFLFAGNNVYPMLAGHLNLVLFMLVPIKCFFIIFSLKTQNQYLSKIYIILSIIIFANFIYGGASSILPFILYTSFLIIYIYFLYTKNILIFKNFAISLFFGLLLTASKISYSLHLLNNFPRTLSNTILGNFYDFIYSFITSFFLVPNPYYYEKNQFNSIKTYMHLHGLEFGLSVVPLIIFILFFIFNKNFFSKIKLNLYTIFLFFLLIVPSFFIFRVPYLSELLDRLPIISNIWERNRFFYIYTIPIIIYSGFAIEKISFLKNKKILLFIFLLIPVVQTKSYHLLRDYFFPEKSFQNKAIYSMERISYFSNQLSTYTLNNLKITKIDYLIDQNRLDKNEGFINSTCKLFCYNSAYGYHAEKLPIDFIPRDRNYFDEIKVLKDGYYNVFNPACLIFPRENNCNIGDRIKKNDKYTLDALLSYKIINYKKPKIQIISNFLSIFTLVVLIFGLIIYSIKYIKSSFNKIF